MNALKLVLISLTLLGLTACFDDDGDSDSGRVKTHYQIGNGISDILLEGSSYNPLEFTFLITQTDTSSDGTVDERGTQTEKLSNINGHLQNWLAVTKPGDNLAVFATVDSSNTDIIAFEDGKVVAKKPGKANLSFTLDSNKPFESVFDDYNLEFTGILGAYDFGEVVVCPYIDITLEVGSLISDENAPIEVVSFTGDSGLPSTSLYAYPAIDTNNLANYGLTTEDCPTSINGYEDISQAERVVGQYIHFYELIEDNTAGSVTGINLLGINFPNITYTQISEVSNPRITEAGYNGNLVINNNNPITIMAYSSELKREVPITSLYVNNLINGGSNNSLYITDEASGMCSVEMNNAHYCVNSSDTTHTISLSAANLPTITSGPLTIAEGEPRFAINKYSGLPGSSFVFTTSLIVNGEEFDTTPFQVRIFVNHDSISENEVSSRIGNIITINRAGKGTFSIIGQSNNLSIPFSVGPTVETAMQGRWVQVDSGEDYYIAPHDPLNFSAITSNQITFQDAENKTITLLKTGIDNVAVSGSVNIVEETTAQANSVIFQASSSSDLAHSFKPESRSLSGIGSIDMILKNANTGIETEVTVEADGTFNEEIPTGIYDVDGTVVDGEITYAIDTQITVERDATDTGKLSLAKVGLYNFDIALSGCEYNDTCYAGKQYEFSIFATNTGVIASSSIEATIGDILAHENVTQFEVTSNPISGAASNDSIEYKFTATFSQPSQDTIIEIPISLTDADARTWEETVKIKLSQYPSIDVNIKAFNDDKTANVRGYLMLEGRTPIRVSGTNNTIKVPNKPGTSYELILANQVYNEETPYAVSVNSTVSNQDITDATGIVGKHENADDVVSGATELTLNEENIAYISAGDVDYYLINIPDAP